MSQGYSPHIPLTVDSVDGFYKLNKTYKEFITQNLKMLLLTVPGERMMDPEFGVGLYRFLFENAPQDSISHAIQEQVLSYMPFIEIHDISFNRSGGNHALPDELDPHYLKVSVTFKIIPLYLVEILEITKFLD